MIIMHNYVVQSTFQSQRKLQCFQNSKYWDRYVTFCIKKTYVTVRASVNSRH